MTTNPSARWFWRLTLLGPSFFLLVSSVILYEVWVFHGGDVNISSKGEGWILSSPLALQFYFGLIAVLSCFAIAGVNATFLWVAGPARSVAIWWSAPIFLDFSNHSMRQARGCASYQLSAISALCQLNDDLHLPIPHIWPFVPSWSLT